MGLERRIGKRAEQKRAHDTVPCICGRRKSRGAIECTWCRALYFDKRDAMFIEMREWGMLNSEIAAECMLPVDVVSSAFADLKRRGVEIPVSPYFTRGSI